MCRCRDTGKKRCRVECSAFTPMTRAGMAAYRKGKRRVARTLIATLPVEELTDALFEDWGSYGGHR